MYSNQMGTLLSSPCQLRLGVGLSHLGYILIVDGYCKNLDWDVLEPLLVWVDKENSIESSFNLYKLLIHLLLFTSIYKVPWVPFYSTVLHVWSFGKLKEKKMKNKINNDLAILPSYNSYLLYSVFSSLCPSFVCLIHLSIVSILPLYFQDPWPFQHIFVMTWQNGQVIIYISFLFFFFSLFIWTYYTRKEYRRVSHNNVICYSHMSRMSQGHVTWWVWESSVQTI